MNLICGGVLDRDLFDNVLRRLLGSVREGLFRRLTGLREKGKIQIARSHFPEAADDHRRSEVLRAQLARIKNGL